MESDEELQLDNDADDDVEETTTKLIYKLDDLVAALRYDPRPLNNSDRIELTAQAEGLRKFLVSLRSAYCLD